MQVAIKTFLSLNVPALVHRLVRPRASFPVVSRPFTHQSPLNLFTSLCRYQCLLRHRNPCLQLCLALKSINSRHPSKFLPHAPLPQLFLLSFRCLSQLDGLNPSALQVALQTVRQVAQPRVADFSPPSARQLLKQH